MLVVSWELYDMFYLWMKRGEKRDRQYGDTASLGDLLDFFPPRNRKLTIFGVMIPQKSHFYIWLVILHHHIQRGICKRNLCGLCSGKLHKFLSQWCRHVLEILRGQQMRHC